jgi:hypothetical protein
MKKRYLIAFLSMTLPISCFATAVAQNRLEIVEGPDKKNVYSGRVEKVNTQLATVKGDNYSEGVFFLSVKGSDGSQCRITKPVAEELGFSLGEISILLAYQKLEIKCWYPRERNEFVPSVELIVLTE